MLISKVYKWRKLIICVVIVLGIAFYFLTNSGTGNQIDTSNATHTYSALSHIKDSGYIDKEMVINSLKSKAELVGLEGHVSKTYIYTDSMFENHGWLKDMIGQRSIQMDSNAFFKMGINLSDITQEDVKIYKNSLFIKIPKQILISLDVPYDQLIIKTKTGLMRAELSESEKQLLYTEARKLITKDIMSDGTVLGKSSDSVKEALQSLLEKIPNVNRIVFQSNLK